MKIPLSWLREYVDIDPDNVGELAEGCELILDGTDNLGTRYLLNDYCVENGVPWIYGGVVGSGGLVALGIWLVQSKAGPMQGNGEAERAEQILPGPDQTISR